MKVLSKEEIVKQGKKYHIPVGDSYQLDSTFANYLFSLDSIQYSYKVQKNHLQPLQVLYFDQSGQLKSFHINCNAGGFPNLKWNRFGNFNQFIPESQTPVDNVLSLEKQLELLVLVDQNHLLTIKDYDYVIFVYWSRFMGRQSKRLIKIVQENYKLDERFKTKIIYVNNDNLFMSLE